MEYSTLCRRLPLTLVQILIDSGGSALTSLLHESLVVDAINVDFAFAILKQGAILHTELGGSLSVKFIIIAVHGNF